MPACSADEIIDALQQTGTPVSMRQSDDGSGEIISVNYSLPRIDIHAAFQFLKCGDTLILDTPIGPVGIIQD